MSFFRYPGGKAKLKTQIVSKIEQIANDSPPFDTYIEPFFGGGSVCFASMKSPAFDKVERIMMADADLALVNLWDMVIHDPETLISKIKSYTPTVDDFYSFKELLSDPVTVRYMDRQESGFMKLAIHQMSFSGLGVKAGGPIGGASQQSAYGVDCRWSPDSMIKKIYKCHKTLSSRNARIYPIDFSYLLYRPWIKENSTPFVYLDPPYYEKGNDLYANAFTDNDHKRLRDALKIAKYKWLLSYDDCPEVRELYKWATIEEIDVNYTIRTARAKSELLIYN